METQKNVNHRRLNKKSLSIKLEKSGYYLTLLSSILLLVWIGIFKFTPTEAQAIKPLIENHPLTFWMYNVFSVQTVSNSIGVFEIAIAIIITLTLKFYTLKKIAGIGILIIFGTTLSFLLTTPGIWKFVDEIPTTDFFILKDLAYFALGLHFLAQSYNTKL